MTINPKVGMYLSIALAVIAYLADAGTTLTDMVGEHDAKIILSLCTLLMGLGNSVNAVLHMIPSQSGPVGAKEFPLGPSVPKAVALLAILVLGALIMPTMGHAQTRLPHVTGRPIEDIKADVQDAKGGAKITTATSQNAGDILNQLRAKFSADVTGDLTSALALAQMVPAGCSATPPTTTACAPSDTTAIPCYQALISLNGVINSYTPPTDKPHVISDLEQLRIVARTIQSTNFKDACAPLVQDLQAQANQLVASVLGIVSGAAKIGIALP